MIPANLACLSSVEIKGTLLSFGVPYRKRRLSFRCKNITSILQSESISVSCNVLSLFALWPEIILTVDFPFLRLPLMDHLVTWILTRLGHFLNWMLDNSFLWQFCIYAFPYTCNSYIELFICIFSLSEYGVDVIQEEIISMFPHKFKIVKLKSAAFLYNVFYFFTDDSVQNLEIIEPLQSTLCGTNNKKRSLFQMLKATRIVGGYVYYLVSKLLKNSCLTSAYQGSP